MILLCLLFLLCHVAHQPRRQPQQTEGAPANGGGDPPFSFPSLLFPTPPFPFTMHLSFEVGPLNPANGSEGAL